MEHGNFVDVKSLGASISELRIQTGPGYRVYFTKREEKVIILLVCGDKSTQSKEIDKAKKILKEIDND